MHREAPLGISGYRVVGGAPISGGFLETFLLSSSYDVVVECRTTAVARRGPPHAVLSRLFFLQRGRSIDSRISVGWKIVKNGYAP